MEVDKDDEEVETDPRPLETAVMKVVSDVQQCMDRLGKIAGRPDGIMQSANRSEALRELFNAGQILSDMARVLRGSGTYFLSGTGLGSKKKQT